MREKGFYQNMPYPPFRLPRLKPRPAAPRPAPHPAPKPFLFIPYGFAYGLTLINLHIKVSSTSIMAPSLSKSPMYPGALNIVTRRRLAKNSYPSLTT